MIELRSDTLTQPTEAMRDAMATAPVGDDVFGEDPTVNALEQRVAALLGHEAAIFVPSGTMSNQIGVRLSCGPGDEFLCEADCHIYHYEQAAYAQLFGVALQPVAGEGGLLTPEQLGHRVRGADIHHPRTKLVCLENTHNRHGGRVLPYDDVATLSRWAADHGLRRHLDGARLWNASLATGVLMADWGRLFNTVSVCFSKGLGAPVGSALVGSAEDIEQARRYRKVMGGGMRQAGVIAAAALFAVDQQFERLQEDHTNAQVLADAVRRAPGLELVNNSCDTNIVLFNVDPSRGTAAEYNHQLAERGVLMFDLGPQRMRAVAHLGVTREQVEQAAEILATL